MEKKGDPVSNSSNSIGNISNNNRESEADSGSWRFERAFLHLEDRVGVLEQSHVAMWKTMDNRIRRAVVEQRAMWQGTQVRLDTIETEHRTLWNTMRTRLESVESKLDELMVLTCQREAFVPPMRGMPPNTHLDSLPSSSGISHPTNMGNRSSHTLNTSIPQAWSQNRSYIQTQLLNWIRSEHLSSYPSLNQIVDREPALKQQLRKATSVPHVHPLIECSSDWKQLRLHRSAWEMSTNTTTESARFPLTPQKPSTSKRESESSPAAKSDSSDYLAPWRALLARREGTSASPPGSSRSSGSEEDFALASECVHEAATEPLTPTRGLLRAASQGEAGQVEAMLAAGVVAADARGPGGVTALQRAARAGHAEVMEVLLRHGADPVLAADSGRTPLECAASSGKIRCVELLLDKSDRKVTTASVHRRLLDALSETVLGPASQAEQPTLHQPKEPGEQNRRGQNQN